MWTTVSRQCRNGTSPNAGPCANELATADGPFAAGSGKVSVVSSSLFGTISGSAVANVMVDGPITIPLMKRSGFRPPFAAAVEAVASTGGQIMPPIMGAAAFVMAEFLSVSYGQVIIWALIPAGCSGKLCDQPHVWT